MKIEVFDSMMLGITTAIAVTRIGRPRVARSRKRVQTRRASAATAMPSQPKFAKPSAKRLALA
ncbi:hypothetical protein [Curtobacterium sp. P97]|uniref:hypothetical protein n=1 Tax=Curtobacterium TaxID=2034 RepID=UPI0034D4F695